MSVVLQILAQLHRMYGCPLATLFSQFPAEWKDANINPIINLIVSMKPSITDQYWLSPLLQKYLNPLSIDRAAISRWPFLHFIPGRL